jgi:MFS family permease
MIAHAANPATIGTLPRREALAFLSLFFVPGVAQAILLTVVPLEALYLLDSARTVTLLYVGTGLVAVAGRFSIPYLVRLLQRRFVFSLGTLSLVASSILLAFNQVPTLAAGLVLSTFAFACIEITSQLYMLDHIRLSSTSSRSASSPSPDRGRLDRGSVSTCNTTSHSSRRSPSPPAPHSFC